MQQPCLNLLFNFYIGITVTFRWTIPVYIPFSVIEFLAISPLIEAIRALLSIIPPFLLKIIMILIVCRLIVFVVYNIRIGGL